MVRPTRLTALCCALLITTATLPVATLPASAASDLAFDLQARRQGGMRAQVATLLVQGGVGGGIAMEVLATATAGDGEEDGERPVAVLIEVEGPTLLAAFDQAEVSREQAEAALAGRQPVQEVEIYAYALSAQGAVVDFFTQRLRLDLDTLGERIYAGGVKFVGSLSLPPGAYSLRVLVSDVASGQYGLRTVPILVPRPQDPGPILLAPLLASPPGAWLRVRQDVTPEPPSKALAESDPAEGDPRPAPPEPLTPEEAARQLILDGEGALPATFPVLDSGAEVEVHLLGQDLGSEPQVTARLVPQEGGEPYVLPVRLLARIDSGDGSLERATGRLQLPELETAAFLLSFVIEQSNGARTESGQVRTLVLAGNAAGPLAWGQLRSLANDIQQATEGGPALDLPRKRKRRASALELAARERYLEALGELATGSSGETVTGLIREVEEDIYGADTDEGLPALRRAEIVVAQELAQSNPEALVPLIQFHLDLYLEYRRDRAFGLATHSRGVASNTALLYAEQADTDTARAIASQALTSLGTEMLEAGLRNSGAQALTNALALDERNEAARLQLAAHYEKVGLYNPAVDNLRRLVEFNPKSAEGRLRLALNWKRTGDLRKAEEGLRRMLSENNPDWTLTIAYTELADLLLEQDRDREAIRVLRQGVDRLPDQDRLAIQLSFALDRQRRFLDARRVLARMTSRDHHLGNGTASPRHRYARGTRDGVVEARSQVVDAARTREPLLADAVRNLATPPS